MGDPRLAQPRAIALAVVCALTATLLGGSPALAAVPVAQDDGFNVLEDDTLTVPGPGVLSNDSDADSHPLTAVLVDDVNEGTLSLNADGSLTYDPNPDFSGTDSFTYRANDGTDDSNLATATITVTPVNDAPSAVNDSYPVNEGATLTVNEANGVLANDSDIDSGALTAVLAGNVSHGSLNLNADGGFSYTPNANYSGSDSFTYRANDGASNSNLATVSITVSAVNDPPTTVPDSYNTPEDTQLNRNQASGGVLANDSDPEGNTPLTASLVNGSASHGTVTFNSNGTFRFTPAANYSGTGGFSYTATDSTGQTSGPTPVTITITNGNDAPVAASDSGSTPEDTPLVVAGPGVLANDTDIDSATLNAALVLGPTHGSVTLNPNGGYTYTPTADYTGTDSFTYRANDGALNSNTATVTLTITPVSDPPVAVSDSRTTNEDTVLNAASVLSNDSDPDGGTLTAVLDSQPARGTVTMNANGTFTYTPAANDSGTVTFGYHATDGTNPSNTATVTITITPVNDAPVAVADGASTSEDTLLSVATPGLRSNDTDIDTAAGSLTTSLWAQAAHGTAVVNANGSWTYQPAVNYNGPDSFSYRVSDGTLFSSPATVTLMVTAVNDAPSASGDGYAATEDAVLTVVAASGVLADDSDVDSASLTAALVSGPSNGTVTLETSGAFTYTPDPDHNGMDSFTYRASDGLLQSSTATVNLTIAAVNDAPTFTLAADPAVPEDAGAKSYPGFLTALDPGPSNETGQSVSVLSVVAANATLFAVQPAIASNGALTFTPGANKNGSTEVIVTVRDTGGTANGGDDTTGDTFLITIVPENDTVFANSDSWMLDDVPPASVEAGMTTVLDVLANDVTLDPGEALTVVSVTQPGHGTATIASDKKTVNYRPAAGYVGSDTFRYTMTDGTFVSGQASVFLSVADTRPPTLGGVSARFVTGTRLGGSTDTVRVGWSASDAGVGVKSYDVQQSSNGGASWTTILSGTTASGSNRVLSVSGRYLYRFRARDKGNRLSAWSPALTFRLARFQETTSQAVYSSGWRTASISSASGDHTRYAKARDRTTTFTFTGRAVSLVSPRGSTRGKAQIRVDGVLVATVDLHRKKVDSRRHVWQRSWASVGSHTVTVRVLGTRDHPRFDVDAWMVLE